MPRLALTSTSAWRALVPPFTVTARPGMGPAAVGDAVAIALAAAATTGPAAGGLASTLRTVRQRLSRYAVLPDTPLTRQLGVIVCGPGPSGITAVTARVS